MLKLYQKPIIQHLHDPFLADRGISLFIKREDLIHPYVSGNKWRKLKYNLVDAKEKGNQTILTFGGAYSNHIYATAAAAKETGIKAIGVIRGEELAQKPLNKTLTFALEQGMKLKFVSREQYRNKNEADFLEILKKEFDRFYLIPEGGTNNLAIKGCTEILDKETTDFDYICSSVGSGGTLTGLIVGKNSGQRILGFSALKGDFLVDEIENLLTDYNSETYDQWSINADYHFGGYGKDSTALKKFILEFENKQQILLDQVYTGKMMFGLYDLIKQDYFEPQTKILAIHTGGIQGRNLS